MKALHVTLCLMLIWTLPADAISPDEWRSDIQQLVGLVKSNHPNPFTRLSESEFDQRADALTSDVDGMTDAQVSVALMTLVASLRDGHSTLHPLDPLGFNHWLPLSFYWFSDGVAIVSAHNDYADLLGSKVTSIGGVPIDEVLGEVTGLIASDNASGNRQNIFYLSSMDALLALGVANKVDSIVLGVVDDDGGQRNVEVDSVVSEFLLNESRFWGEMYAPVNDSVLEDMVMPFESLGVMDYFRLPAEERTSLPLHVRHRSAYWSTYLPGSATYYMQINHTTSAGREAYDSFEKFYTSAFEFVENNKVDKFILDIRYNSGGDGSILIPFIHQFVRSDKVNRLGHLYTIVGRKTYSAATMMLDHMIKHTNTLLVGEPGGSALNSYGDSRNYILTHSGMLLDLSSEYWKLVHTSESPVLTPIHIPAVFSSNDYFSGRDPALEKILAIDLPYRTLDQVLAIDGADAATKRYRTEKNAYRNFDWWLAFDESNFRKVARGLVDDGKTDEGLAGFKILVEEYPESWRAWRDFGKAYLTAEQHDLAKECLLRAQALNPGDSEINELLNSA